MPLTIWDMYMICVQSETDYFYTTATLRFTYMYVESCVREHHVYKNVWSTNVGEQLSCTRDTQNLLHGGSDTKEPQQCMYMYLDDDFICLMALSTKK